MRVGNFSLSIPEGTEKDSGHIGIEHGKQYTIVLRNHDYRRCDAEVTVDGKAVGCFRLSSAGDLPLETKPGDGGRFTFYKAGTADAAQAGEQAVAADNRGLIQVRFVPESRSVQRVHRPFGITEMKSDDCYASSKSGLLRSASLGGGGAATPGITGMSGHSDQKFVDADRLTRDESGAVTITVRLVAFADGPRPLVGVELSNPVPVPVPAGNSVDDRYPFG